MYIIRQTFTLLRQNLLLSIISILGTAFAITMIMAIVITGQTKYSNLEPEVNRSSCLYFSAMHLHSKDNNNNNWGECSPAFMKACVMPLKEVAVCTAFSSPDIALVSMADGSNRVKVDLKKSDPGFWKIFRFRFLNGHGFTEEDRISGTKAVVISASVARKVFGKTDVSGQNILLNREAARICGVVKDVSVTAKDAYAQVWTMYPSSYLNITSESNYVGGMTVVALPRNADDIPAIKQGITKLVKDVNAGMKDMQLDIMDQPDGIVAHVNHVWANVGPNLNLLYLQYIIALAIILLVPSLNLCGLSNSRMQQRISELGVRKAFGATRGVLIRQILNENMLLTLLGGLLGLCLSYLAVYGMRMWLFTNGQNIGTSGDFSLSMGALFNPWVFFLAFLFCFLINMLSAGLPAWLAARRTIVDSLNDR